MKADVEKLRAARELVARPGGWTTNVMARDANGKECDECSEEATCFCTSGALCHVGGFGHGLRYVLKALKEIYLFETIIPEWNDRPERKQTEVVALFDKAIQLAEAA